MLPSELGLPDNAPWYGARPKGRKFTWVNQCFGLIVAECKFNTHATRGMEIAAFADKSKERSTFQQRIIAGPVAVKAEVVIRKVKE